jgi:hypothetical protein
MVSQTGDSNSQRSVEWFASNRLEGPRPRPSAAVTIRVSAQILDHEVWPSVLLSVRRDFAAYDRLDRSDGC